MSKSNLAGKTGSLYSQLCDVPEGEYAPHVDPREAAWVWKSCNPLSINHLSCKNSERNVFIADIGGLALDVIASKNTPKSLPRYIPIVDHRIFGIPGELLKYSLIGVSLKDVFLSHGEVYANMRHAPRQLRFQTNLLKSPIFEGKEPLLFSSGKDSTIEGVWQKSLDVKYFPRLAEMGFSMATGFNFSVFWGECALGQAWNTKRGLITFGEYQAAGISAIPHFYWENNFQLERILGWILKNPHVRFIAVNCQCYRAEDIPIVRQGIQYLVENSGRDLRLLLEGGQYEFLAGLSEFSSVLHFAAKAPGIYGWNHIRYVRDGSILRRKIDNSTPREVLATTNFEAHEAFLREKMSGLGIATITLPTTVANSQIRK